MANLHLSSSVRRPFAQNQSLAKSYLYFTQSYVIFREGLKSFLTRVRNHPILGSHKNRDFQVMFGFEPFIVNSSNFIFDVYKQYSPIMVLSGLISLLCHVIHLFCYGGFIFGSAIANTFPAVPLINLIKRTKQT